MILWTNLLLFPTLHRREITETAVFLACYERAAFGRSHLALPMPMEAEKKNH